MLKRYSNLDNDPSTDDNDVEVGHHKHNLIIMAFPTNDFHQETGTNEDIKKKVIGFLGSEELYNSPNFVLFEKSSLKTNPIYKLLRQHMPHEQVKHNFYKYILDSEGTPVAFYNKKDTLLDIEKDILIAMAH